MVGFDPLYFVFAAPAMLLAMFASWKVKSTFAKYQKKQSFSGLTGAQAAKQMLQANGIYDVQVQKVQGFLSDNYNPVNKTLNLSPEVYEGRSLSSVGVACHEAGHALQHASGYAPLKMRSALVPVTSLSSRIWIWIFFAGILLQMKGLMLAGVALFSLTLLFALVTLPVEWDASARAKVHIVNSGIVSPAQGSEAGAVLNAAFLTYVASAISSLMTLLYYVMRSGLLNDRR